ncbi:MAG: hypothetical protein KKE20_04860 [Nanoarchaeota archaeon]|nr:hypothetical protein [Nanoarchaeota archaeon]
MVDDNISLVGKVKRAYRTLGDKFEYINEKLDTDIPVLRKRDIDSDFRKHAIAVSDSVPGSKYLNMSMSELYHRVKHKKEPDRVETSDITIRDLNHSLPLKETAGIGAVIAGGVLLDNIDSLVGGGGAVTKSVASLLGFGVAAYGVNFMGDVVGNSLEGMRINPSLKGGIASAGSSLPELFSSTVAAVSGSAAALYMSLSNYIGSNLFNPTIIAASAFGLSYLAKKYNIADKIKEPIKLSTRHLADAAIMLAVGAYTTACVMGDGMLSKEEALPLAISAFPYTAALIWEDKVRTMYNNGVNYIGNVMNGKSSRSIDSDCSDIQEIPKEDSQERQFKRAAALVGSIVGLKYAADYAVGLLEKFVSHSRMPADLAGSTILAVSTSLPEAAISGGRVKQIKKKLEQGCDNIYQLWENGTDMIVDTVQKSNIYNLMFAGFTALMSREGLPYDTKGMSDFYTMLAIESVLLYSAAKGRITRNESIVIGGTFLANMAYRTISNM